jgi:hypothetical protein
MVLSATFNLEQLECVEEHDNFGAEPYLWTAFFHSDAGTIAAGQVADTIVPLSTDAGRGAIPDGVDDGETVAIPTSIGRRSMTIDPSGTTLAGVIFVLIEENFSSQSAMAAGQLEFRNAFDSLLDPFLFLHANDDDEALKPALAELATKIQARVVAKIRAESSWTAFFKPQDRFLGFGVHILKGPELLNLATSPLRSHKFSVTLKTRLNLPAGPHTPPPVVFEEYEVRGSVRARQLPPGLEGSAQATYDAAFAQFEKVNAQLVALHTKLATAPHRERASLKEELRYQDSVVLAVAADAVDVARRNYYEFVSKTDAGRALVEQRADRQRRKAEPSSFASSPFSGPPVTVAFGRVLNDARASETAPIDRSADAVAQATARDMTG